MILCANLGQNTLLRFFPEAISRSGQRNRESSSSPFPKGYRFERLYVVRELGTLQRSRQMSFQIEQRGRDRKLPPPPVGEVEAFVILG